jgi:hypothetical protein
MKGMVENERKEESQCVLYECAFIAYE